MRRGTWIRKVCKVDRGLAVRIPVAVAGILDIGPGDLVRWVVPPKRDGVWLDVCRGGVWFDGRRGDRVVADRGATEPVAEGGE